jgi:hypothetical protein
MLSKNCHFFFSSTHLVQQLSWKAQANAKHKQYKANNKKRRTPSVHLQSRADRKRLCSFATNASRQLDVLGHDGDALGVDGAEVGVLKQADEVRLGRFLQRQNGRALEAQIVLEILSDLAHEALELVKKQYTHKKIEISETQ